MGKILSENRRARFDYEVLENFEAGIELSGQEVKSAKSGRLNLSASYAVVKNGEVWLLNSEIPAYQPKNAPVDYDSKRTRRLLLRSPEIKSLMGRLKEKNLTLVALNAHLKKNLVKIELGLARSRNKHDKREALKKKAIEREIRSR